MPDTVFDDSDEAAADDEYLDTELRRRLPPWALPLAAVLVLVLVIGVVLVRRHAASPQAFVPAPLPSAAPSPSPSGPPPTGVPNIEISDVYALVGDAPDSRLFALSSDRLFALRLNGQQIGAAVAVHLGAAADAEAVLLFDPTHHRLWVVPQSLPGHGDRDPGIVSEFDSRTLRQIGRFVLQVPVFSAAVLDGRLYIASSGKLYRLDAASGRSTPVLTTASQALGLAADPTRHRLVYFGYGSSDQAGSWSPAGRTSAVPLPMIGGTIVVSDGAIWAGGASHRGGVLVRLDPRTLEAGPNVLTPVKRGSDVSFAGAGQRSLYLFSAAQSDTRISCLDARSGRLLANATSSGVPTRPSGIAPTARSTRSASPALAWMPVAIMPGLTALTRMPLGASSRAAPSVNVSTAPFDAA